mgnify:FL=1
MKKIIFLIFISSTVFSQKKDIVEESFEVNGVCKMCKSRIEKTAFKQKGVKNAEWDINNHLLTVLYDKSKIDINKIHKSIAEIGHDTSKEEAPDEVYDNLPMCCLYNRNEIKKGKQ